MKNNFVSYSISEELKGKGFKEPCLFAFDKLGMRCCDLRTPEQKFEGVNYNSSYSYTSQPSYQQVLEWLMLNHGIFIELIIDGWMNDFKVESPCYRAFIWRVGYPKPKPAEDLGCSTYQNILEISIKESLSLI